MQKIENLSAQAKEPIPAPPKQKMASYPKIQIQIVQKNTANSSKKSSASAQDTKLCTAPSLTKILNISTSQLLSDERKNSSGFGSQELLSPALIYARSLVVPDASIKKPLKSPEA